MKKYFLVQQPPLAEKLTFLVDELNESRTVGIATDFDKIEYNLKLIGDDFNQDLEIGINFLEKGITDVVDLGRYISVIAIKKDKTEGKMYFFDTTIAFSRNEIVEQIGQLFSEITTKNFMTIYDLMKSQSTPSLDNVELLVPLES
ncbi:hypothetical protein [Tenacibaculum dicentrarchi]|uniref:hypothetical protein n=1 Tax=Tenacibaculum dicentrarchi TaxID=669041 RepID=UPI000C7C29E3|nr:conserved hypothetical protein [Tenacibaculum dicentrarchi]